MVQGAEYDFLRENSHLGSNIMFLTLGGSHAYGTNVPGSDVDVRGVTGDSKYILLDLLEDIDGSIVTYISVDELTWIIAFNIIFFAIYISFFIKAKKWDKKLAKEENAVEAESEKEDDSE